MSDDDGFLGRWSRLKQKAREEPRTPAEPPGRPPAGPGAAEEEAAAGAQPREAGREIPEAELPDPESLGRDDDWSVFLRAGVPKALKRRALRRLWRLDPVLANLDGLNDYDEDFNRPELKSAVVKTLFKIGKGMVAPEEKAQEVAVAPPPPAAEQPPVSPEAVDDSERRGSAPAPMTQPDPEAHSDPEAQTGPGAPSPGRESRPASRGSPQSREQGAVTRRWSRFRVAQPKIGDRQSE